MNLYFVRHGESEANLLAEFSNRGLKHGLTEQGKEQARALARSLKNVSILSMFSSPLLRARQTADILAHELGVGCQVTEALREFDCGVLEGRSDAASWRRYADLIDAWLVRWEWEQRLEQGESFLDIRERFVPFVAQVVRAWGASDGAVVLVGHGGLYRCMLPLVLRNIDFAFVLERGMDHASAVVAELTPEGLLCSSWGEEVLH